MKKAEIILFVLICLAFSMKIMNVPYSALLITFATLLLSMLYSAFGFALLNGIGFRALFKKENYSKISNLRIVAGVGLGFIFSAILIYSLFRIQFWPYGRFGLQIMLPFLAIAIIVMVIFYIKNRKQFLQINIYRLVIIGVLSLNLYLVSTDTLVDLYYGDKPEFAKEYKESLKNPEKGRPDYYRAD